MSHRHEVSILDYKSTNKINIIECMVQFKLLCKPAPFYAILDPTIKLSSPSGMATAYRTLTISLNKNSMS